MTYHNRIMNIKMIGGEGYKEGHRDARHAAAEIALEADAEIEELRRTSNIKGQEEIEWKIGKDYRCRYGFRRRLLAITCNGTLVVVSVDSQGRITDNVYTVNQQGMQHGNGRESDHDIIGPWEEPKKPKLAKLCDIEHNDVKVEIELTINPDGEWVAYGDNSPTQNTWHNSTKYKIIANIPKPTTKTIHTTQISDISDTEYKYST